jgi:hypothetical protein
LVIEFVSNRLRSCFEKESGEIPPPELVLAETGLLGFKDVSEDTIHTAAQVIVSDGSRSYILSSDTLMEAQSRNSLKEGSGFSGVSMQELFAKIGRAN